MHNLIQFSFPPIFAGQFKNGRITGEGKLFYHNGDEYSGEFADWNMHGKGSYRYAKWNVYEGEWRDNERHGKGTVTYVNPEKGLMEHYEGDWVNGQLN